MFAGLLSFVFEERKKEALNLPRNPMIPMMVPMERRGGDVVPRRRSGLPMMVAGRFCHFPAPVRFVVLLGSKRDSKGIQ